MIKLILAATATLAFAAPALSAPGGEGGNTSCNGAGNPNSPCEGGQGGQGGQGGVGVGVGLGVGVAHSNSAASNKNDIANINANSASSRNDIENRNVVSTLGVNVSKNDIANAVSNTVGNTLGNVTSEGSSASTANANNSSVTVAGDEAQRRNPVSTAYSADLVAGNDTCMGSTSMGAQGIGFGLSIGSTWTDKNCMRIKNSRELAAFGHSAAAVQLLCIDKEVRRAMKAAGTPCKD